MYHPFYVRWLEETVSQVVLATVPQVSLSEKITQWLLQKTSIWQDPEEKYGQISFFCQETEYPGTCWCAGKLRPSQQQLPAGQEGVWGLRSAPRLVQLWDSTVLEL